MTDLHFTKAHAAAVLRYEIGTFAEETPANGYSEAEFCTFARKLSWLIDADVLWATLEDAWQAFQDLAAVANCTHEDIDLNRSGSVDNRAELTDRIETTLTEEITYILERARFAAHWEPAVWVLAA
ncbi:hypothetical protein [Paenarthrobacter ureafaciens]|uniref:hypothetical protein n=1 Tax=Paenarthrobacter ureafaciens TaxID=37931 RepID=UPI001FB1B130|nr:hypothetical protein [Paenarthrobacter ureafaciens]UOD80310.1 hypothetical protein MQZ73_14475 [Paenarthrobacter ureafaciens]WNZ04340.1 hypothetical protein PVT25_01915 [Paenarthrobacter ureafaciens]